MFDIAKLDTKTLSESGVDMIVRHPANGAPILDDAGKPVSIGFLGVNSAAYKGVQRALRKQRVTLEANDIESNEAEQKRQMVMLLTAVTIRWSFDTMDGEPLPFSTANAEKLWSDDRWRWLANQAFVFVNQEANFLALSAGG